MSDRLRDALILIAGIENRRVTHEDGSVSIVCDAEARMRDLALGALRGEHVHADQYDKARAVVIEQHKDTPLFDDRGRRHPGQQQRSVALHEIERARRAGTPPPGDQPAPGEDPEVLALAEFLGAMSWVYPNLNDTFAYACADTQALCCEQDNDMTLARMWVRYRYCGIRAYAAHVRGQEPIRQLRTTSYRRARKDLEDFTYEPD